MKFKVITTGSYYNKPQAAKLKKLGFTFKKCGHPNGSKEVIAGVVEIEILTLEELLAFSKKWGDIIISDDIIEIYDDYRE